MSTVEQAIQYCETKARQEPAILWDDCRRILLRANIPHYTEVEKWNAALSEAEPDTYSALCRISTMRLES